MPFIINTYSITRITWYFHKIRPRVLISHIKLVKGGIQFQALYVREYRNSSVKKVRINKQPGRFLSKLLRNGLLQIWKSGKCWKWYIAKIFILITVLLQIPKLSTRMIQSDGCIAWGQNVGSAKHAKGYIIIQMRKIIHWSEGTMKYFITSQIYNKIAFSLFASLLSIQYLSSWVDLTRFVTDFAFFFSNGQFIVNFFNFRTNVSRRLPFIALLAVSPKNCRRNTRKKDKVYDFLQFAKLTWMDGLCTQTLRSISQSSRQPWFDIIRWHFGISLNRRDFPFYEFKGHPRKLPMFIKNILPSSDCPQPCTRPVFDR